MLDRQQRDQKLAALDDHFEHGAITRLQYRAKRAQILEKHAPLLPSLNAEDARAWLRGKTAVMVERQAAMSQVAESRYDLQALADVAEARALGLRIADTVSAVGTAFPLAVAIRTVETLGADLIVVHGLLTFGRDEVALWQNLAGLRRRGIPTLVLDADVVLLVQNGWEAVVREESNYHVLSVGMDKRVAKAYAAKRRAA